MCFFFFFQAEDGIRDVAVTGVQTCALPISPDTITVGVGLPVRWTNEGRVYHTVVSDSSLWSSNLLAPTWWFEVRFDSAGTFPYHCSQHAGMTGTVIVTP